MVDSGEEVAEAEDEAESLLFVRLRMRSTMDETEPFWPGCSQIGSRVFSCSLGGDSIG